MGEESEKRFEAIMNKLFRAPSKSKLNAFKNRHGVPAFGGKKLISSSSTSVGMRLTGNGIDGSERSMLGSDTTPRASLCRPWDRADFFGRLSTFKSMTWFAKPQVVSPVNCARRGWINVDVDTIGCISCESRLHFSTPTTWTLQQVEKAAAIFSLKLESGHKLLCPWINNICSEEITHFPPVSHDDLIQDYKKRCLALSHLTELPAIAPIAINNMRSPMLDNFLREISAYGHHEYAETSRTDHVEVLPDSLSSISYYQIQNLISLCGWEPKMLPYIVDFKDGKCQPIIASSATYANWKRQKVDSHSLPSTNDTPRGSGELQFDPNSSVLHCNLCGASVGLWTFCTVARPVEYVRLVGSSKVNDKNDSADDQIRCLDGIPGHAVHAEHREWIRNPVATASTSFGITIAGGPPPVMLSYNATISLPVVGRNLRARLLTEIESRDQSIAKNLTKVDKGLGMSAEEVNVTRSDTLETGPDFVANNLLDMPKNVTEPSGLNESILENETLGTGAEEHRPSSAGEYSCVTQNDNLASNNGGETKVNGEDMTESENIDLNISRSNCQGYSDSGALTKQKTFRKRESAELASVDKTMEFDLIKLHRHFCPWIVSSSKSSPGWQQTLSALNGHPEFSSSFLCDVPVAPVIEMDVPVASVIKIFSSPNDKGTNVSRG